ncbi:MAG TPA: hypothetical protein VF032_09040 [Thermoleophilaceae bacterium]
MELRARPLVLAVAVALLLLAACSTASAAGTSTSAFPTLTNVSTDQTQPPKGYRLTPLQAITIAQRAPKIADELRRHPHLTPATYTESGGRWQVSWFAGSKEMAQAIVDDRFAAVTESWTGYQVAWRMARGYPGAFGRKFNATYVWLPLGLLFLVPFLDPRRPFRLLHLDLLVLVAFAVSHFFFERGNIGMSVPLVYPVLGYLFVRMLVAGFRRRGRAPRGLLVPVLPIWVLGVVLFGLIGFRVALNMVDSNVVDVGYSGVIGAHKIARGQASRLYDGTFPADNVHGDTYGPVDYLVYVPFERIWPWSGSWNDLPAAHAAAIAFDVLTMLGLFLLGRRLRAGPAGRHLGIVLAYAWAAYPYTLFTLASNSNDTLVAMFGVYALLAIASPLGRGALTGLAAAAKFVSLALGPLFARGTGRLFSKRTVEAGLAVAVVFVLAFLFFIPSGGLHALYDRTLGYQINRPSPFSVWGQAHSLNWLHTVTKVVAVGLAVLVAFVPRRRDVVTIAALAAAILVAFQIAAGHWFYLYIVWFTPFALVALMTPHVAVTQPEAESARSNGRGRRLPLRSPLPSPRGLHLRSRT